MNDIDTTRRNFLGTAAAITAGGLLLSVGNNAVAQDGRRASSRSVKGTETEQCLLKAFAGESQARNRYTFFAERARSEGFQQIAAIFEETAEHEMVHARTFFRFLQGGMLDIQAGFPAGRVSNTQENLLASAEGEHEEWAVLYPEFAKIAEDEGFAQIARSFTSVAVAEKMHEKRYRDFLKNIESDRVFRRDTQATWVCRNCGFTNDGTEAAANCPACGVQQAYFQLYIPSW